MGSCPCTDSSLVHAVVVVELEVEPAVAVVVAVEAGGGGGVFAEHCCLGPSDLLRGD